MPFQYHYWEFVHDDVQLSYFGDTDLANSA